MIEQKTFMGDLEAVLAIDEIEMIKLGTFDYEISLSHLCKPYRRDYYQGKVAADRDRANQMALAAGFRPRAEAGTPEQC